MVGPDPRTAVSIIAHRGASSSAPENTVAAMMGAVTEGADMIELDVQMTRDRRLVLFHDAELGRTTNFHGVLASNYYSSLRTLDAGGWFDPRFAGEPIPLLSDILAAIPSTLSINLELKPTAYPGDFVRRLVRDLRDADRLAAPSPSAVDCRPLVSSEDVALLEACAAEDFPLALVTEFQGTSALETVRRLGCVAWHPCHSDLSPAAIAEAHAQGVKVNTWTVDDLERMRELVLWGVDGIITNVPKALRTLLSHEEEVPPSVLSGE